MAAYAALCSLMHIIHQIQNHPCPPILIDKTQVESLTEHVTFLQEFLEGYSHVAGYTNEADPLEAKIVDAAHAVEDVIESHIVDRIHAGSTRHGALKFIPVEFYEGLRKVIEDLDSIMKEVMEIKEKMGVRDQLHMNSKRTADSSRPSSTGQNAMVGFDEALLEILDKLTQGQQYRQVIPIVGMGGMGKTTLVKNVYVNPIIEQHFDICAWATISQEYDAREILREVLCPGNKEELSDIEELGEKLHKHLSGRRYVIVMDDMWSIEVWDEVRRFFPDNNNGSRIVITTRLSNLTSQLTGSYFLEMKFLDEDKSWNLLRKTVFVEKGCPLELEGIGKKIAKNCRGLPLSIVVTGGPLVKSQHSHEYWEYIAENLNSLVNSADNERCLNILYMSYKELPVYLKPCFLYLGIFSEDSWIRVTMLIRSWVAEGFLKPISGRSLEEIAEEYLEELIDRNLVHASRSVRKIKRCRIHDLLRDLCLREAQKERFYYVVKEHWLNDFEVINTLRRIVIPRGTLEKELIELQSMSVTRSLIWEDGVLPQSLNFRLLRIMNTFEKYRRLSYFFRRSYLLENMFDLVNSRYFDIHVSLQSKFPPSVFKLWNLQTLIVTGGLSLAAPTEIWMMPQLRHVVFSRDLRLPDPPRKDEDIIVLGNLQSLSTIVDFKSSEEVIQRIPNLKKLGICYYYDDEDDENWRYFLNNLDRLHKLESFHCDYTPPLKSTGTNILHTLSFPYSLKKLTLDAYNFNWDKIMEKIYSIPLLEVLNLRQGFFTGRVWETVEDQFSSLKLLKLTYLRDLEYWNSDSTHFPCLEQLVLKELPNLKEIPSGIGDIPTLQSIVLSNCSYSAAISAKNILVEQEEFRDVTLHVRVYHSNEEEKEALKRLASPNFKV